MNKKKVEIMLRIENYWLKKIAKEIRGNRISNIGAQYFSLALATGNTLPEKNKAAQLCIGLFRTTNVQRLPGWARFQNIVVSPVSLRIAERLRADLKKLI